MQPAAPITAVRAEPPPTLQRLPGLSSLPGVVRDRPALPTGTPEVPTVVTNPPTGIPGSLRSLPSTPVDPGLPTMTLGSAPEQASALMPMPVASARALVAAVAASTPAGGATPTVPDGIPGLSPVPGSGRDPDSEAAAPSPRAGTSATATSPAPTPDGGVPAAGAASTPQQLDELARRLYDPLASRLRAELLLDRERRGLRTDAW